MIPPRDLFAKRDCRDCGFAHHFDLDNQIMCVFSIVRAETEFRKTHGISEYYRVSQAMTPNRQALLEALNMLPNKEKMS